jgi:creatinine amidohydrolase
VTAPASLARLTWTDVDAGGPATLLVPVGATEQHGPHLPCTTDTDIATALATSAAARLPNALVAPALPYGSSGEHAAFAGTLSIGAEATELVLVELGRSARATATRVVLISTHGGNAGPVARAVGRLAREGSCVDVFRPRWAVPADAHAGRTETSLMLALAPDRVRVERAEAGDRRSLDQLMPELRRRGVAAVSPNGVLGDPAGASAEEGHRLLAAAVDDLVDLVRAPEGTGVDR